MLKFKSTYQDCQAGKVPYKCFSQVHNRMAQVGFEQTPCQSQLCCSEPLN